MRLAKPAAGRSLVYGLRKHGCSPRLCKPANPSEAWPPPQGLRVHATGCSRLRAAADAGFSLDQAQAAPSLVSAGKLPGCFARSPICTVEAAACGDCRCNPRCKPALEQTLGLLLSLAVGADLLPTTPAQRTFGTWELCSLWIGLVISNTTFFLASALIQLGARHTDGLERTRACLHSLPHARHTGEHSVCSTWASQAPSSPHILTRQRRAGFSWRQGILCIFFSNVVTLLPMVLNGYAGCKYGLPSPVLARAAFGVRGANLPSLARGLVACGCALLHSHSCTAPLLVYSGPIASCSPACLQA